ncbi:MAG: PD40 domain-containing protein, partial [Flavobacteriales bacterium]|nr:PD40 domain-containing protein [Flavobacteriales bacterium]
MLRGIVPTILVLCALALTITLSAQDYKNEKQLIKNAEAAFNAGNYTEAMPLYSNLVSKYNKDPNFNYRYGACLLFAGADKEKPLKYLSFAASRPDVDVEAHYYLGLAQHLNYHFSEAIKSYEKFKVTAKPELVKSLSVENRIAQCRNGKSLLSNITDLIVLDKQSLAEADFYKMYDLSEFGGQILSKPEDLQTAYEKKAGIESILFLPKGRDTLYFSGVEAEGKSRDIFMAIRKPDGTWSAPQTLGKTINSEYDEDYAFFHPDEQRLYFASKGHNSLGGYDVFTAKYNPASGTWGAPVNLDFAICTPADDYMLITDKSGTKAFFASNRESPAGMVNVYRINLQRIPLDFALIYGTFTAETTKKAVIKVENAETGEKIGEFLSDETGKYKLRVPNNGKFRLLVDYQNSSITHSGELELRNRSSFKPLKQEMLVMHQGTDNETLVIKNLFDEEVADVEPVITPDFLKEKARLEINEDKFKDLKPELIVQESATPTSKEQAKPEEAQGPVMESGGEQGTVAKTEEPVDDRPILAEQPEVAAKSTSAPPTVTETSQAPKSSPKTSATTSTSPRQSASSGLKLKVGANPTNAEIAEVAVNNITALNNDAAILLRESEVAAAIASEKSESAKTTRAKAAQLLAGMDTNSAEVKNNAQYKEARELERQAAFIDKEAATAARLADNLKESAAEAETSHKLAEEYAMGITNNQNGAIEDNIKRYNQLSDYVDSRLSKEIRLSDMREDAQQRYAAKTAESSDLRQSADEIND